MRHTQSQTATRCPCCGRRSRARRAAEPAPAPLLEWGARQAAVGAIRARVILHPALCDAAGEPRPCLLLPGRRAPVAFPNMAAALAALRTLEARDASR